MLHHFILAMTDDGIRDMAQRATGPDVIEAGRVMATLNDWRAIMFVLLVLVAMMFGGLMTAIWASYRVGIKSAIGMSELSGNLTANNVVLSRNESHATQAMATVDQLAKEVAALRFQIERIAEELGT